MIRLVCGKVADNRWQRVRKHKRDDLAAASTGVHKHAPLRTDPQQQPLQAALRRSAVVEVGHSKPRLLADRSEHRMP